MAENRIGQIKANREAAATLVAMILLAGDLTAAGLACVLSYFIRFTWLNGLPGDASLDYFWDYQIHMVLGIFALIAIHYRRGAYRPENIARFRYASFLALTTAFYWAIFFVSVSLFFDIQPPISRLWVALAAVNSAGFIGLWRYGSCRFLINSGKWDKTRRKTLIVGWGNQIEKFYRRSERSASAGYYFPFDVRAVAELKPRSVRNSIPEKVYAGSGLSAIKREVLTSALDTLIFADDGSNPSERARLQELCAREMVDFMLIPNLERASTACLKLESFAGFPLLRQDFTEISRFSNRVLKRFFDVIGALVGLLVSFPVILWFCWRVHRESPGPVFYTQRRLGRNGQLFKIIKIRSMRLDAEKESGPQWARPQDRRCLRVGQFMRRYNIDELPQFWNVLRGEMSLVGPRPERPELVRDFKHDVKFYNLRHTIKPGVTGWAQINGWRGDTSLESRIACDLEYMENWSVWFDLYICLKTLKAFRNAY